MYFILLFNCLIIDCKGNMANRKTDNSCKCETGYYDKETTG